MGHDRTLCFGFTSTNAIADVKNNLWYILHALYVLAQ
jgi:hypothetical protein